MMMMMMMMMMTMMMMMIIIIVIIIIIIEIEMINNIIMIIIIIIMILYVAPTHEHNTWLTFQEQHTLTVCCRWRTWGVCFSGRGSWPKPSRSSKKPWICVGLGLAPRRWPTIWEGYISFAGSLWIPLVNVHIIMENHHFSWESSLKLLFSAAMLNYQRVVFFSSFFSSFFDHHMLAG